MDVKKRRNAGNSSRHKTGKVIQTAILDYVRNHKYTELGFRKGSVLTYKIEVANERGVPDLLCCVNGCFVGIEIKGRGDKITAIQVAQAERIITAKGESYVVKSLEEFKERIGELLC